MFARKQKPNSSKKGIDQNNNSSSVLSRRGRKSSSMNRATTPGARSQATKNSVYSSNRGGGSFTIALSELEALDKEDEEENAWYETFFKRVSRKVEERRERRKAKKVKRMAKKIEREKRKQEDDFDPGTDGFEFYRWNGRRLQAELFVFIATVVFVFLFCILSIVLYCFAFRGLDSAIDGAGHDLFNITSASYITASEHPWTIVDAIYFTTTSFLGNGFGDVVPTSAVS